MNTLLELSGVSVSFDGFKAINNLSFQIGPRELRAVIGPNGAGKTTFMDIVTGNWAQRNRVYRGNGNGTFAAGVNILNDVSQTECIAAADLDEEVAREQLVETMKRPVPTDELLQQRDRAVERARSRIRVARRASH